MSIFRRIMLGGGIGIDAIPDSQKIYYKATAKVTPMSNSLGVTILTNNWNATTGEGIIICGSNIEKIEDDAFYNRTSLTSINIPDSVTTIGDNAFSGCASLVSITIPNSVTSIGDYAFSACTSLESVTIPDSVTEIGITIFSGCTSLTSIIVSEGNSIYDSRENCNAIIKTATNKLAIGCNSTIIPNSVTSIGDYAFNWCTILTSINIPDIVTTIGGWAFYSCKSLTSVTIPDSVTSIGDRAFDSCNSLTSVYCKATTPPSLGDTSVFDSNGSGRTIYVPTESVDAYKSATNWSEYADAIVGVPNGVSIQHIDGKFYTTDDWVAKGFSNDEANGVALKTEEVGFVIAKTILSFKAWSSDTSNLVDDIMTTTSLDEAKKDFAGATNTALMLATDTSGAAYDCNNYTFPNGAKGYLPSLGEWNAVYQNGASIDAALALIGGDELNQSSYWSSTQYSATKVWCFMYKGGPFRTSYKDDFGVARAFSAL